LACNTAVVVCAAGNFDIRAGLGMMMRERESEFACVCER
jgi:hypothetical protein